MVLALILMLLVKISVLLKMGMKSKKKINDNKERPKKLTDNKLMYELRCQEDRRTSKIKNNAK